MGEFLSTPIKDKVSEDNENELVINKQITNRFVTVLVECKDGVREWKTLIFQI